MDTVAQMGGILAHQVAGHQEEGIVQAVGAMAVDGIRWKIQIEKENATKSQSEAFIPNQIV